MVGRRVLIPGSALPRVLFGGLLLACCPPLLRACLPPALLLRALHATGYAIRWVAGHRAAAYLFPLDLYASVGRAAEWTAYSEATRHELLATARRLHQRLTLILTHGHAHARWQTSRSKEPEGRGANTPSEHEVARGEFLFCCAEFFAAAENLRREAHRIPAGCAPAVGSYVNAVIASLGCDDPLVEVYLGQCVAAIRSSQEPAHASSSASGARPHPSLDASTSALQLRMIGELMLQDGAATSPARCTPYARFCQLMAVREPDGHAGGPIVQLNEQAGTAGLDTATTAALQLQAALAPLATGYDELAVWSNAGAAGTSAEEVEGSRDASDKEAILNGTLLGARIVLCVQRLQELEQACAAANSADVSRPADGNANSSMLIGLAVRLSQTVVRLLLSIATKCANRIFRARGQAGGGILYERLVRCTASLRAWSNRDSDNPQGTSSPSPAPVSLRAWSNRDSDNAQGTSSPSPAPVPPAPAPTPTPETAPAPAPAPVTSPSPSPLLSPAPVLAPLPTPVPVQMPAFASQQATLPQMAASRPATSYSSTTEQELFHHRLVSTTATAETPNTHRRALQAQEQQQRRRRPAQSQIALAGEVPAEQQTAASQQDPSHPQQPQSGAKQPQDQDEDDFPAI